MGEILAALFGDTLRIWMDLLLFIVLGLTGIPAIFKIIPSMMLTSTLFIAYIISQYNEMIFPSKNRLEQLENSVRNQTGHAKKGKAPDCPSEANPDGMRWEYTRLEKILSIIGNLLSDPPVIKLYLKNDFDISEGTVCAIKHKFKILFFFLSTLAALITSQLIPQLIPLGIYLSPYISTLSLSLISWGINPNFVTYGAVVLSGGITYSMRAPVVGIFLGINHLIKYMFLREKNNLLHGNSSSQASTQRTVMQRCSNENCKAVPGQRHQYLQHNSQQQLFNTNHPTTTQQRTSVISANDEKIKQSKKGQPPDCFYKTIISSKEGRHHKSRRLSP